MYKVLRRHVTFTIYIKSSSRDLALPILLFKWLEYIHLDNMYRKTEDGECFHSNSISHINVPLILFTKQRLQQRFGIF